MKKNTIISLVFAATLACGVLAGVTGCTSNSGSNSNNTGNSDSSALNVNDAANNAANNAANSAAAASSSAAAAANNAVSNTTGNIVSDPAESPYVGLWQLRVISTTDTTWITNQGVEDLRLHGGDVALELTTDQNAAFYTTYEGRVGTWSETDGTATLILGWATVGDNADTYAMRIDGENLILEKEGTFIALNPVAAEDAEQVRSNAMGANYRKDEVTIMESDYTMWVDSDRICIVNTGKAVNAQGIPGYALEVHNKTDNVLNVGLDFDQPFNVNGNSQLFPVFEWRLAKGESRAVFMAIDWEAVPSVEALESCAGSFRIADPYDNYLESWPFSFN